MSKTKIETDKASKEWQTFCISYEFTNKKKTADPNQTKQKQKQNKKLFEESGAQQTIKLASESASWFHIQLVRVNAFQFQVNAEYFVMKKKSV